MKVSNGYPNLFFFVFLMGCFIFGFSSSSFSLERLGAIGISGSVPVKLSPEKEKGPLPYSLDFSYFFDEAWATVWSLDFHLTEKKRVDMALGPQWFLSIRKESKPYLLAQGMYFTSPKDGWGWKFSMGWEWNLVSWTQLDNLRLSFETGVMKWFLSSEPNAWFWEVLRIRCGWSF